MSSLYTHVYTHSLYLCWYCFALFSFLGAGKSTTLHFLCGTEFSLDSNYKQAHYIATNSSSPTASNSKIPEENRIANVLFPAELDRVRLDYKVSASVTQHITPVSIQTRNNSNKIVLCDTPGFADSRGDEIEVANSLSLIETIHCAKSVRIILVISKEDMSSRSAAFKEISDNLKQLLSNYNHTDDNSIGSMSRSCSTSSNKSESKENEFLSKLHDIGIIFTKFEDIESIYEYFDKFYEETNASQHGHYLAQRIVECEDEQMILIDPIHSDREKILNQIVANQTGIKWINNTKDKFKSYVPESAMIKMRNQVSQELQHIKQLINKSEDLETAKYLKLIERKLDDLIQLREIIKHSNVIANGVNSVITAVDSYWNLICNNILNNVKNHDNMRLTTFDHCIWKAKMEIKDILAPHTSLQRKYLVAAPSPAQMIFEIENEYVKILTRLECVVEQSLNDVNNGNDESVVDLLIKCLIMLKHFNHEKEWKVQLLQVLNRWRDLCSKWMTLNEFEAIKRILSIFDSVREKWLQNHSNGMNDSNNAFGLFFFMCSFLLFGFV